MKLSGEQFQAIISQLISDKATSGAEKRVEPRVGVRAQGSIFSVSMDERDVRQIPVTIRDLSHAGICIVAPVSIQRGARFVLDLPRFQQVSLKACYEVRHSKPLSRVMFAVGAKLVAIDNGSAKAA